MQTIIPFVPTHDPQLSRLVYEMILAHFLRHDHDVRLGFLGLVFVRSPSPKPQALLRTIKAWPHDIYDVAAVTLAIQGQIDRQPNSTVLMESVAELFVFAPLPPRLILC